MEIKNKIRKYRKQAGLTQYDLAKKTGLSVMTIRRYENGDRIIPNKALKAFARAMDLPENFFIEEQFGNGQKTDRMPEAKALVTEIWSCLDKPAPKSEGQKSMQEDWMNTEAAMLINPVSAATTGKKYIDALWTWMVYAAAANNAENQAKASRLIQRITELVTASLAELIETTLS